MNTTVNNSASTLTTTPEEKELLTMHSIAEALASFLLTFCREPLRDQDWEESSYKMVNMAIRAVESSFSEEETPSILIRSGGKVINLLVAKEIDLKRVFPSPFMFILALEAGVTEAMEGILEREFTL